MRRRWRDFVLTIGLLMWALPASAAPMLINLTSPIGYFNFDMAQFCEEAGNPGGGCDFFRLMADLGVQRQPGSYFHTNAMMNLLVTADGSTPLDGTPSPIQITATINGATFTTPVGGGYAYYNPAFPQYLSIRGGFGRSSDPLGRALLRNFMLDFKLPAVGNQRPASDLGSLLVPLRTAPANVMFALSNGDIDIVGGASTTTVTSVPEVSSLLLALPAFGGLLWRRRVGRRT